MALTEKQQLFADEYLIDLNAKQAAIRAGYSPRSAEVTGCKLLRNAKVRAYVDKAMAERSKRTGINQDRVLIELARIGLVNPKDLLGFDNGSVLDEADEDDLKAISSVKVKTTKTKDDTEIVEREVKLYDKIKALELIGKHLGMFTDKVEVKADMNVNNPFANLSTEELRKLAQSTDQDD